MKKKEEYKIRSLFDYQRKKKRRGEHKGGEKEQGGEERGAKGLRLNINTLIFGRHGREKE